jgi:hypothetical protein
MRGQEVSARKIGTYVSKLQIVKVRGPEGFYIPLAQQTKRIDDLVRYYQLDVILEKQRTARGVPRSEVHGDFKEDDPGTPVQ